MASCFNPRTPAGCDALGCQGSSFAYSSFNPRTPAGCDLQLHLQSFPHFLTVSTHAPLRGATDPRADHQTLSPVSTHAPLRGATFDIQIPSLLDGVSTHAPLRGATLRPGHVYCWCRFNPRTPAGCDILQISTMALSVGFNPRTPAGCDSDVTYIIAPKRCFNPRTPAGCDSTCL